MTKVLILGGTGCLGRSIAADLLKHTNAEIILAGRNARRGTAIAGQLASRAEFLQLDLDDRALLSTTIARSKLVIHCAGPFSYRDVRVLQLCILHGVHYLDVSDNPTFVKRSLALGAQATDAGITAIISTGIFPGISNGMARLGVEALDEVEKIQLNYVVEGSGGAGATVMRTTFLEICESFTAWIDGEYQAIEPYRQREIVQFPAPYGSAAVYTFSTSEVVTLPLSFPVKTVMTKFGSLPGFYNTLTGLMTGLPKWVLKQSATIELLAKISYGMTQVSDRFTGIGIAMQGMVHGQKEGRAACAEVTFTHPHMITTVGYGTGSIAELILSGELQKPGVWSVEQGLSSPMFLQTLERRNLKIEQMIKFLNKEDYSRFHGN